MLRTHLHSLSNPHILLNNYSLFSNHRSTSSYPFSCIQKEIYWLFNILLNHFRMTVSYRTKTYSCFCAYCISFILFRASCFLHSFFPIQKKYLCGALELLFFVLFCKLITLKNLLSITHSRKLSQKDPIELQKEVLGEISYLSCTLCQMQLFWSAR